MNRNVESHFAELPKIDIERSIFDRSSSHKTAFNCGELIPFYLDEVLPGDTFNLTTSCVVRLQTPLTPIMDNIYLDTYFFFVPNRLVWSHWKEFMGENTESAWVPTTEYQIPRIAAPTDTGWSVGSLADYFGIPPLKKSIDGTKIRVPVNALPFRGYALICNEFFRDQNLTDPLQISTGDADRIGVAYGTNYITDVELGGAPFKVAKYHDYFTSVLPSPQKGDSISLFPASGDEFVGHPIGGGFEHFAPVFARNDLVSYDDGTRTAIKAFRGNGTTAYPVLATNSNDPTDVINGTFQSGSGNIGLVPANLWADMSKVDITINELRMAFQLQKFLERDSRSGTRYREMLKAHFGVTSSDARMQIPEYLGGHRFPLSIHQVTNQTSGESEFLGDLGAMSNTSDVHEDFVKSFEEHGFVFGLCCVRYDHSYSQGVERFWLRKDRVDYYFPVFANLGEQMVYKDEIYWDLRETNTPDHNIFDWVFGYQEAWSDYRYKPSRVSSEMRPDVPNSLASWHLGDYYTQTPVLSDGWIREDKSNIDRVLSVTSDVAKQVFADFYVKNICTRPMPMYSIPGLVDHH